MASWDKVVTRRLGTGTSIVLMLLFAVACQGSGGGEGPSSDPRLRSIVDCGVGALSGPLAATDNVVQIGALVYEAIDRKRNVEAAFEEVYGKDLSSFTPDERADALLILHGLDSCEAVSPPLGEAMRGIVALLGPVPTIEGEYALSVEQATCVNLDDCNIIDGEDLGVHFLVSDCEGGSCSISSLENVWASVSSLVFDGSGWHATGTETLDFGFYCYNDARPTAFDLQFRVDSSGTVSGTYLAHSTTSVANCGPMEESFDLAGSRA